MFNLHRILRAAACSLAGLGWLARNEAAFRQELALFALLLAASPFLGIGGASLAVELGLMCLVLTVEALNTALEKLVDRVSLERHPLSGLVKDIGSAAVFLSFLPLGVFWLWALFA